MNLFNPLVNVKIGNLSWTDSINLEVSSCAIDWAKIYVINNVLNDVHIANGEAVDIKIGYDETFYNIFSGNIDAINGNVILCKDDMIKLAKTTINIVFTDVTPQDIISYCLSKAGINNTNISADNHIVKKVVVVNNKSVIDILKMINDIWNIKYRFYFDNRCFVWSDKSNENENEILFSFNHKENIISLENIKNEWIIEAVVSPFIKPLSYINVSHPRLSGKFKVKKVLHKYYDGFTRSYIYV